MSGSKVIIVTGGNSGIGLETAKGLCELGHDVVISTRDDEKGSCAVSEIKAKVPNARIMYITMELVDPQSIRRFVNKFLATEKPLHVLINNAGLCRSIRDAARVTARDDPSLELTMTANCMGTFLLTNLILDKLKTAGTAADPARIINVSSGLTVLQVGIDQGPFLINDIMLAKDGRYMNGMQAYRNSKVAINLWTIELARRLRGTNVIANSICPGFIPSTSLARESEKNFGGYVMMKLLNTFIGRWWFHAEPLSAGRDKLIKLATGENRKTAGIFYMHDKQTPEAADVLDEENQEKIWSLCVTYSGLKC